MADKSALRRDVAIACRIIGREIGSMGHVSARIDDREMYLRCRGDNEAGLLYADTPSVRRMDFDGTARWSASTGGPTSCRCMARSTKPVPTCSQ